MGNADAGVADTRHNFGHNACERTYNDQGSQVPRGLCFLLPMVHDAVVALGFQIRPIHLALFLSYIHQCRLHLELLLPGRCHQQEARAARDRAAQKTH